MKIRRLLPITLVTTVLAGMSGTAVAVATEPRPASAWSPQILLPDASALTPPEPTPPPPNGNDLGAGGDADGSLFGPPPPPPPSYDHSPDDAVIYPQGTPVAVLEMQTLALVGQTVEVVMDDSAGDIAEQRLEVEGPDGNLLFVIIYQEPPSETCWVRFYVHEAGLYTATLTVTSPDGRTDSDTGELVVISARPQIRNV